MKNKGNFSLKTFKIVAIILTAAVLYYFLLPPINIHDIGFWFYILILLAEYLVLTSFDAIAQLIQSHSNQQVVFQKEKLTKPAVAVLGLMAIILVYIFGSSVVYAPIFASNTYANRIQFTDVEFSEVPPYSFNKTAIIDRASAQKLGDKVMGEMTDLVSQFNVSSEYSQISFQEGTYRVTPLAYDGFIKYLKNRGEGIPGYIIVNTTTGEASLKRLDQKMKYVPSGYFNERLVRKLRFNHPFEIFGSPSFEIDEEGNPYYVCTTYTYKGVGMIRKVDGVVLFNPVDGTSIKYDIEDAPTWIDRIYPEDLVTEEINHYGLYHNGFINSFFGQEGVVQTSEGYNYISKDGDIWLYTGITSVVSDSSNIGFALVNLRTHEAQKITTSGADEYAIMDSAEGEVLNYGYTATFPVLVNIDNEPVYILSLKDSAGLVKMYALVDAKDYQQVYTTKADRDAKTAIEDLIKQISKDPSIIYNDLLEKTIIIDEIEKIFNEGTTVYYILSDGELYEVPFKDAYAKQIVFAKVGDELNIHYQNVEGDNIVENID